jgi:hypothetical protein
MAAMNLRERNLKKKNKERKPERKERLLSLTFMTCKHSEEHYFI